MILIIEQLNIHIVEFGVYQIGEGGLFGPPSQNVFTKF